MKKISFFLLIIKNKFNHLLFDFNINYYIIITILKFKID